MKIRIKTLDSRDFTLELENLDGTVATLKERIQEKSGIVPDRQRLIFQGRPLTANDRSLASYGIQDDFVIHLVERSQSALPTQSSDTNGSWPHRDLGDDMVVTNHFEVVRTGVLSDQTRAEELVRQTIRQLFPEDSGFTVNTHAQGETQTLQIRLPPNLNPVVESPSLERVHMIREHLLHIHTFFNIAEAENGIVDIVERILAGEPRLSPEETRRQLELIVGFVRETENEGRRLAQQEVRWGHLPFDDDNELTESSQSPPPLEGEEMETDAPLTSGPNSTGSTPRVHQNDGDPDQGLRYRMRHALATDLSTVIERTSQVQTRLQPHLERYQRVLAHPVSFDIEIPPESSPENSERMLADNRANAFTVYLELLQRVLHRFSHVLHLTSDLNVHIDESQPRRLYPQYQHYVAEYPSRGVLSFHFNDPAAGSENETNDLPADMLLTAPSEGRPNRVVAMNSMNRAFMLPVRVEGGIPLLRDQNGHPLPRSIASSVTNAVSNALPAASSAAGRPQQQANRVRMRGASPGMLAGAVHRNPLPVGMVHGLGRGGRGAALVINGNLSPRHIRPATAPASRSQQQPPRPSGAPQQSRDASAGAERADTPAISLAMQLGVGTDSEQDPDHYRTIYNLIVSRAVSRIMDVDESTEEGARSTSQESSRNLLSAAETVTRELLAETFVGPGRRFPTQADFEAHMRTRVRQVIERDDQAQAAQASRTLRQTQNQDLPSSEQLMAPTQQPASTAAAAAATPMQPQQQQGGPVFHGPFAGGSNIGDVLSSVMNSALSNLQNLASGGHVNLTVGSQNGVPTHVRTSSAPLATPMETGGAGDAEFLQRHMSMHRNAVAAAQQHNMQVGGAGHGHTHGHGHAHHPHSHSHSHSHSPSPNRAAAGSRTAAVQNSGSPAMGMGIPLPPGVNIQQLLGNGMGNLPGNEAPSPHADPFLPCSSRHCTDFRRAHRHFNAIVDSAETPAPEPSRPVTELATQLSRLQVSRNGLGHLVFPEGSEERFAEFVSLALRSVRGLMDENDRENNGPFGAAQVIGAPLGLVDRPSLQAHIEIQAEEIPINISQMFSNSNAAGREQPADRQRGDSVPRGGAGGPANWTQTSTPNSTAGTGTPSTPSTGGSVGIPVPGPDIDFSALPEASRAALSQMFSTATNNQNAPIGRIVNQLDLRTGYPNSLMGVVDGVVSNLFGMMDLMQLLSGRIDPLRVHRAAIRRHIVSTHLDDNSRPTADDIESMSRRLTISREDLQSFLSSSNADTTSEWNGTTYDLIETAIRVEQEAFRRLLTAMFDTNMSDQQFADTVRDQMISYARRMVIVGNMAAGNTGPFAYEQLLQGHLIRDGTMLLGEGNASTVDWMLQMALEQIRALIASDQQHQAPTGASDIQEFLVPVCSGSAPKKMKHEHHSESAQTPGPSTRHFVSTASESNLAEMIGRSHISPPAADDGSWRSVVPQSWVDIIAADIERMSEMNRRRPAHSDMFTAALNRNATHYDDPDQLAASFLNEGIKAAARASGVPAPEELVRCDPPEEALSSLRGRISDLLARRLESDPDFDPSRFPNLAQFKKDFKKE